MATCIPFSVEIVTEFLQSFVKENVAEIYDPQPNDWNFGLEKDEIVVTTETGEKFRAKVNIHSEGLNICNVDDVWSFCGGDQDKYIKTLDYLHGTVDFINKHLISMLPEIHKYVKPGTGATISGHSDAYAATVVKVTATQIQVRRDKQQILNAPNSGEADALQTIVGSFAGHVHGTQRWATEEDPQAPVEVFRRHKDGRFYNGSSRLYIGHRNPHYDYNF